jgi:DNA repair ATPase RecN
VTAAIIALAVVVLALIARDAWVRTLADRAAARSHATTALEARVASLAAALEQHAKDVTKVRQAVDQRLSARVRA